jgi:hypothetical protein
LGGDWAWRSTRFGSSVPKTAGADKPPSWIAPGVVHPPTEPRPASHPVIGRTVGDPLARRGHSAHRLRADNAHTPWTSQHVSVVSLQVLQAMLAGDIARWSAPRATTTRPDSTAAHGSEAGRVTLGGRRVRIRGPWSALGPYRLGHPGIPGGHERSRRVPRKGRSPHLHAQNLGCWGTAEEGSNPTSPLPRAGGPCQRGRLAGVEPHPAVELMATLPGSHERRPRWPCH